MAKKVKEVNVPDLSRTFSPSLLGEVVKAKRTQSHITQADAAALCGIAKQTYIKIEQGRSDVKVSSLMQVIAALGIKLSIESWTHAERGENRVSEAENDIWV